MYSQQGNLRCLNVTCNLMHRYIPSAEYKILHLICSECRQTRRSTATTVASRLCTSGGQTPIARMRVKC